MSAASDLTQASWQAFSRLLDEALELAPEQRQVWLDALGAEHDAVKPALQAVLARAGGVETAHWLATLPRDAAALPPLDESDLRPGVAVGPYRLLRELGAGGMGAVWLAERADGSLKRQVALKLPRASWSRGLAERMARERDILAALEHPNIARLYDAGTDAQGRPYLALEYVEGQPIDAYCRARGLSVRERVGLLLQVAQAVVFAHSRLVVHRDLKPSNILVTAEGQVRLLDFGIAKLMEGDRAAETQLTQLAGRALTPDYASPEQIRGEPIGTASDVYSLGVVAFELLTGARPYKLKRGSAAEVEDAVLAADVPLASSLASDAASKRALRGDLDAILAQALRKDVAHRYASVEALADDLGRHLAGQPVTARPDSRAYRLRKFVARNRLAVGASVSVALALAVGAGVSLWQARVAQREAQAAEAVTGYLLSIFTQSSANAKDPIKARSTTARELLDIGAQTLDEQLKSVPAARARVLGVLGSMYVDLDLHLQAAQLDERRVALLRETGADERTIASALLDLCNSLQSTARRTEIGPYLEEARRLLDAAGDRDSPLRGELMVRLARYNHNHSLADAVRYADEAVRIFSRLPDKAQFHATSRAVGARARVVLGDYRQAAEGFQASVKVLTAMPRTPHQDLAISRYSLADVMVVQQRFGEALATAKDAVSGAVAAYGEKAPAVIVTIARAAGVQHALGEREAARKALAATLENVVAVKGEDDPLFTPIVRSTAARAYLDEGRIEEAVDLADKAMAINRRSYGGSPILAGTLALAAATHAARGDLDQASALLDEAEVMMLNAIGGQARPWQFNMFHLLRARIALARSRPADALAALARVVRMPDDETPFPAPGDIDALALRAQAHLAVGDVAAAQRDAEQAARGAETLAQRGAMPSTQAEAALSLGRALMQAGKSAEAAAWLDQALRVRRQYDVATSPALARTLALRAQCALRLGNRAQAQADAAEARRIVAGRHLSPWFTGPVDDLKREPSRGA